MTKSRGVKVRSRIEIIGVNPYVTVRAEKARLLGKGERRPIPVRFQINRAQTNWRVNPMPTGNGSFHLYLNGEIRKVSNVRVGDTLNVDSSIR